MENTILREATAEDFKVGTTLIMKNGGWRFTIVREYAEGIWECGKKVHFTNEARHYNVEA